MLTPHAYLTLTSFGGILFVLPFILAIAFSLAMATPPRTALVWLGATGCALGTILILKLVFIPCGTFIGNLGIHSPSGHMAGAVTAYGGLAVVIHRLARHGWLRWGVFFIAALFCAGIGYSRIVLGAHVPNEVYLGALAGLVSPLILLFALPGAIPVLPKPLVLLAPALTIVILLLIVGEAGVTPEGYISNLSREIAAYFHVCGFNG
ncbi:MAG: phosphatase PAP2 family protein [Parvibaculaceae bacterium]|nr:phosphatase PAP2 family protein [Parvibaculaceae bacterium]